MKKTRLNQSLIKEFSNRSKLDWVIYRFQKAVQAQNHQNIEFWCGALPQIDN